MFQYSLILSAQHYSNAVILWPSLSQAGVCSTKTAERTELVSSTEASIILYYRVL